MGKPGLNRLHYISEYILSSFDCRRDSTKHDGASQVPFNKAENKSLGTLAKLPAEILLDILEIVLDIDRAITTRTCYGILSTRSSYCDFHQQFEEEGQTSGRTRFALMHVSSKINKNVMRILHNKTEIRANANTIMLTKKKELGLVPCGRKNFSHMRCISRFRHLQFTFPSIATAALCKDHIDSVLDALRQLDQEWTAQDINNPAKQTRHVVIHLGTVFAKYSSREQTVPSMEYLEKIVELIATSDHDIRWAITAVSDDSPNNEDGQYRLSVFKELLKIFSIGFQEKTMADHSVLNVVKSRGVMGGTHQRFLD